MKLTATGSAMSRTTTIGRTARNSLARLDIAIVRRCVALARSRAGRFAAIASSWMGNGPLYIALAAAALLMAGRRGAGVILIAAINIGLLHQLYPIIKRWTARPRPSSADTRLVPLLRVLDEHSFPSGHSMTLTAALLPIVLAIPGTFQFSLVLWVVMAWSRLATAHHYPSDVLAGTMLGAAVSYPLSGFGLALLI